MPRDYFFGGLLLLASVLLVWDMWPAIAGTPERVLCDGGEGQTKE